MEEIKAGCVFLIVAVIVVPWLDEGLRKYWDWCKEVMRKK